MAMPYNARGGTSRRPLALGAETTSRRRERARNPGPATFALGILAYVGVVGLVEPHAGYAGEIAIGVVTWLLLLAAVRALAVRHRARVAAVVLIASVGEVLGSLVLGLYAYRRGGIPLFVPPGHGLIYLAGWRIAQSSAVRRHERAAVRAAVGAGLAWAVLGLTAGARPDVAGALAMLALLAFLLRGREPKLFATMLLVVALLELYGTQMGIWRWEPTWPVLDLPAGNPPSGVAAGYCAFDALALRLGPRLERLSGRLWHRGPRRAAPHAAT